MRKHILVFVAGFLCVSIEYAHAQKGDYIASDSSVSIGVNFIRNTSKFNSQYIKLAGKGGETKYTPEQIKEYGFKDGTVYESKKILVDSVEKKVFLERMVTGRMTLYRYAGPNHRTYYIKKDSSALHELRKDLESMKALSEDCEFMRDAVKLASYNKASLRKLVSYYNECVNRPFVYKKIGMLVGWRTMRLMRSSNASKSLLQDISIPSAGSPVFGIFGDLPFSMSDFSLHPELLYTWHNFSANTHTGKSDIDVQVNLKTLQLPILVRYTLPTLNWRLFVDAGPTVTYNYENSSDIYYSEVAGNVVSIERPGQQKLLADVMLGYAAGVGLQRQLNYRKTLSAEFRYSQTTGSKETSLNQRGIDLVIGFTF